jgi:hypothetical protein
MRRFDLHFARCFAPAARPALRCGRRRARCDNSLTVRVARTSGSPAATRCGLHGCARRKGYFTFNDCNAGDGSSEILRPRSERTSLPEVCPILARRQGTLQAAIRITWRLSNGSELPPVAAKTPQNAAANRRDLLACCQLLPFVGMPIASRVAARFANASRSDAIAGPTSRFDSR